MGPAEILQPQRLSRRAHSLSALEGPLHVAREVPGIAQDLGADCGSNHAQVVAQENCDGYKVAAAHINCVTSTIPFSRGRYIYLSQHNEYATDWYKYEISVDQSEGM